MYLGLWAVGAIHSTATLSSEGTCGLYGLRLMHRLNIFLSCFGPRAGQAIIFCRIIALTLTLIPYNEMYLISCAKAALINDMLLWCYQIAKWVQ